MDAARDKPARWNMPRLDAKSVRQWAGLAVLCAIGVIGGMSQLLISILLEPIRRDIGLSDTEIGLITGLGISVVGAVAAFPIGWAADRHGRRLILGACVLVWSISCVGMGLAQSQRGFTAGAIGINLGDAALIPLLYAMLSRLFLDQRLAIANAVLVAALVMGSYGSYALGGLLLGAMELSAPWGLAPWRAVAVIVALSGLAMAALLPLVPQYPEPERATAPDSAPREAFTAFLKRDGATVGIAFFGVCFYYTAFGVFTFWGPAMLERSFEMATADANIALGVPLVIASVIGLGLATLIVRRVRLRWGVVTPLRMITVGCAMAIVPAALLPFAGNVAVFLALLMAMSVAFSVSLAMVPLFMQSCAPNRFLSRTIALFPVIAIGHRVIFPAAVGALSDRWSATPDALVWINVGLLLLCLPTTMLILWRIEPRYRQLATRAQAENAAGPAPGTPAAL